MARDPIWQEIEAKKRELDGLRPLAAESLKALEAWYDVELTWSSTAIEGNTLTRSETAIVLEKGFTVRGKPLKDHMEALDHKEALDYVRSLASATEPIRETDIRQIQALVVRRTDPEEAGRYSRHQRLVAGSRVTFPSPVEIPPLMADFSLWLAAADPSPETAFEAHYRLVTIHPFTDGNGRTARLLMNLLLWRADYPPVVIAPEHRADYLDRLEERQMGGEAEGYVAFMAERLVESLMRHVERMDRGESPV